MTDDGRPDTTMFGNPRFWLVLAGVVLMWVGFGVGIAHAAATPYSLHRDTEAWLEQTLHTPIPDRRLAPGGPPECDQAGLCTMAWATRDGIYLTDGVWLDLMLLPAGFEMGSGEILIHEELHSDTRRSDQALEEGVVEALAQDLWPAWLHAMGGVRPAGFTAPFGYPRMVWRVRWASAAATGGSWRSRAARLWRRDLWRADDEGRALMMEVGG